jgi:DNA-nicking Smr family endonuclease
MSPRDGKRRPLSREEKLLWKAVTKSVTPRREQAAGDDEQAELEAAVPRPKTVRALKASVAPPAAAKPAAAPPLTPLGRRMKQRVARGKDAIDGKLDLHGLSQSEAHSALLHFLRGKAAQGARLVLVITGKGRGDGERGVLKRQVPHWLALPEFRALVIGFEDAHIAHGGEGALYVRLRRARGEYS